MNPRLELLQPYPFERLRALMKDITPNAAYEPISLGIGEPKHPTPAFIKEALSGALDGLANYPATTGVAALREACAAWARRRYAVTPDPATQVLPVNGSREALFAIAQTVVDATKANPTVACPNPFYQIYEGAALLAGARSVATDWQSIDEATWAHTQLLYVCTPGNPTGAVLTFEEWRQLFELSDRHGFVIASDECYSEIWFRDAAPLGSLAAAHRLGRDDFRNLVMFTSLSKRSNVPGMRSGFVAGDARLLSRFLLYRTYHGSAMSPAIQQASIAAWNDEAHVVANRDLYRAKFEQMTPLVASVLDVQLPDAGFYLWADVSQYAPIDDIAFARGLYAQYNVGVLPGSLLARDSPRGNPGRNRIRLALVAPIDECLAAAHRIVSYCKSL